MKSEKSSIAVNLSLRFMIILTAVTMLLSMAIIFIFNLIVVSEKRSQLITASKIITDQIQAEKTVSSGYELPYFISYIVFDMETGERYSTNDPFLPELPVASKKVKKFFSENYYLDEDLNILYYSVPVNDSSMAVQVSMDLNGDVLFKLHEILPKAATIILIPLLLVSFFVCFYITKKTIAPVVKMISAVDKISSENFDDFLPVGTKNNELDRLARTFNGLLNRLKEDFERERSFTGNVSHELKTPVAVITGEARLLKRWGKDDKKQLEYSLDTIIEEGKTMEEIISNLLQMTKLDNGQIKVNRSAVNLKQMFERIKKEFVVTNKDVIFNISADAQLQTETDEELIHQLLTILVHNSIKFCGKDCTVNLAAVNNSSGVELSVTDNGKGFDPEDLPHIFERFYRGDKAHTRSAGGSGLGLSIASLICKNLGAQIKAGNSPDGGAEVIVLL